NDVLVLAYLSAPATTLVTVRAGGGNDTINVGSNARRTSNTGGNANLVTTKLVINGEGGNDTVVVDETAETAATALTLDRETIAPTTYGRLHGLSAADILYDTVENLDVNLGGGGN